GGPAVLTSRSVPLAAPSLLTASLATATALGAPAPAAAQEGGVDCDGVSPVIDGEAQCIPWARGPVTDGAPMELEAPAGTGSTTCLREGGVDAGSPPAQLDAYGPREIACVWDGVRDRKSTRL